MLNVPAHSANRHSGNLWWVEQTCSHLNCLGAVSSTDIHDRYVQYTVTKQLQQYEIPYLVPNGFTMARADNLDFQQPHPTVYSGDQSQSWHGTTMQLVQPRPHSLQNPHPTPTGDPWLHCNTVPFCISIEAATVRYRWRVHKKVCRARTLTKDHTQLVIAPHDPRIYTSITSTSTVFQLPWTRRQKCWHLWCYAKWRGGLWWFCHCHNNPHDAVRSRCLVDTSPLIPDLSTYLEVLRGGTTVEKSTMAYLEIMDKIADRKDTSFFFSVSNPWLQGEWSCFSTFSSSSASHCTRRRQQS